MIDGKINLVDLDFEYKFWKHRLQLFIVETDIIFARNIQLHSEKPKEELNAVEVMVLDQHKEDLEKLLNLIKVQEQELQFYNKDFPITNSHSHFVAHLKLRKKMEFFTKWHLDKMEDLIKELGI